MLEQFVVAVVIGDLSEHHTVKHVKLYVVTGTYRNHGLYLPLTMEGNTRQLLKLS